MPAPTFDAPLTLGAQLEARASHPEVADRLALRQGGRSLSYRELRDEAVRTAHLLLRRHGKQVCRSGRPRCELCPLAAGCAYAQGARRPA